MASGYCTGQHRPKVLSGFETHVQNVSVILAKKTMKAEGLHQVSLCPWF